MADTTRTAATRRISGISIFEMIAAIVLVGVVTTGAISVWRVTFNVSASTHDAGIGYQLARRWVERIRATGFDFTPDGTSVYYYDGEGDGESAVQNSGSRYSVTVVIASDRLQTTPATGAVRPAQDALRTVAVSVRSIGVEAPVYATGTFLVRSGL